MAVIEASDASFAENTSQGVCIVDFWSTHCGPCRMLLPVLLKLEAQMPFLTIVKVNTDDCPELTRQYKILGLPTVYLGRDGALTEYHGVMGLEELREAVGKLMYQSPPAP